MIESSDRFEKMMGHGSTCLSYRYKQNSSRTRKNP